MSSKICVILTFMLGIQSQHLFANSDILNSAEKGDVATHGIVQQEDQEVKKIVLAELPEDRLGRKAIRGKDPLLYQESEQLKQLWKFEQSLAEDEQADRTGGKLGVHDKENPSVDRELIRKITQVKNPPKGYFRFEDRVLKYIDFYQSDPRGRSILTSWLKRQGRYRPLIESVLTQHQLPSFLLYVAMIESGYDPHDRSSKGAVGLWQFMPEGARIYGLRVDYWVDERKDPLRATEAVAHYFEDLHERFGSWHLALAAFNAGYGGVLRSIQKYNTNDYWKLSQYENGLPWETRLYVPKAIATAVVGENLDLFGYPQIKADPALEFDQVTLTKSISLANLAKILAVSEQQLTELNPHLKRGRTPPLEKDETWTLYIPSTKVSTALLSERVAKEAKEDVKSYVVPFGQRPEDIATQFGISKAVLWQLNGIEDRADVRAGMTLLIPGHAQFRKPAMVQNPEELVVVAVPDKHFTVPGRKQIFYRVIYGDTVSAIAQFFKVKQQELVEWNNLDLDATLSTSMVLSIWVPKKFDTSQTVLLDPKQVLLVTAGSQEFMDAVETLKGRKRIIRVCQEGETLETIAKEYHLTVASLERINGMGKNLLEKPGQNIIVYQPISPAEQKQAVSELWKLRKQEDAEKRSKEEPTNIAMTDAGHEVETSAETLEQEDDLLKQVPLGGILSEHTLFKGGDALAMSLFPPPLLLDHLFAPTLLAVAP